MSGTTQVSQNQKRKTRRVKLIWIYCSKSEWQWHQLGHMQICTSPQTDNHASIPPLSLLQARCPSCCPRASGHLILFHYQPTTCGCWQISLNLSVQWLLMPCQYCRKKQITGHVARKQVTMSYLPRKQVTSSSRLFSPSGTVS